MWTIPYLVSVLCMQYLARDKKRVFKAPLDSDKGELEERVQKWEKNIMMYKEWIEEIERALSLEREALQGLLPSSPGKWLIIISSN